MLKKFVFLFILGFVSYIQTFSQCVSTGTITTDVVCSSGITLTGNLTINSGVTVTVPSISVGSNYILTVNGNLIITNNTNALVQTSTSSMVLGSNAYVSIGTSGNSATNTVWSIGKDVGLNFASGSFVEVNGKVNYNDGNTISSVRDLNGDILILGDLTFGNNNGNITGSGSIQATGTVTQPSGQPVSVYGSTSSSKTYPVPNGCLTIGNITATPSSGACPLTVILPIPPALTFEANEGLPQFEVFC
ncbi:MAG: hypothetical protein U0V72_13465 [Cytophagales bacterium]